MSPALPAFGLLVLALVALVVIAVLFRRNRALGVRLEARARFYAMRDPLTELPTRALLHSQLAQVVAHADRIRRVVAVLFIDLDRFK
ncbi:MAG TPA: diguanylate cyclase, partial [Usitatibacter sp.]|nr:diguanylate cyclase [Usitatibacter sp.]